jgi:hypothetical protein
VSPYSNVALPTLAASVASSANYPQATVIFQAASAPGVDPVEYSKYQPWLQHNQYIYFSTVNKVYRLVNYRRIDATTFIADIVDGILPAIADVAYQLLTPSYVFASMSYSYVVTGAATINDVPIPAGISFIEPSLAERIPRVVAYDASAVGASILISINE